MTYTVEVSPKMESFPNNGSVHGVMSGLDDLGTVRAMTTHIDLESACLRMSSLLWNAGQGTV